MDFEDAEDDDLQRILEGRDYDDEQQEFEDFVSFKKSVERKSVKRNVDSTQREVAPEHSNSDPEIDYEAENEEEPTRNDDEEAIEVPVKKTRTVMRRFVLNPRPKLDVNKLKSDRGIAALPSLFDNVKFKGKGYEKDDLNRLMLSMQHWANRLMPSLAFDDFIEKCEALGHKRQVQTFMTKMRLGLPLDVTSENQEINDDQQEIELEDFERTEPFDAEAAFDKIIADDRQNECAAEIQKPSLTEEQLKLIEEKKQQAIELRRKFMQQAKSNNNVNEDSASTQE